VKPKAKTLKPKETRMTHLTAPLETYDHISMRDREAVKALDHIQREVLAFQELFPFLGGDVSQFLNAIQRGRRDSGFLTYYRDKPAR
jgi:hypothetical protein